MRRLLRYGILLFGVLSLLAGCGHAKTIPDDKLERIFEDIFLANSYCNSSDRKVGMDSLDIYRPILEKHGYEVVDLTYTIENYSKRKSAKISDVVEASIRRLESRERYYSRLVADRDSLQARAVRQFADTVYFDSLIQVFSLNDTAKLWIEIPVTEGDYRIMYNYLIDSLDQNGRPASTYEMADANGRPTNTVTRGLSTRRRSDVSFPMTAKPGDRTLRLKLAGYGPNIRKPHVTIEMMRIIYNLPVQAALDSLFAFQRDQIYTFPSYVDQLDPNTPYSGTLRVDPPRLLEGGDDND